jgi:hypothetical protein
MQSVDLWLATGLKVKQSQMESIDAVANVYPRSMLLSIRDRASECNDVDMPKLMKVNEMPVNAVRQYGPQVIRDRSRRRQPPKGVVLDSCDEFTEITEVLQMEGDSLQHWVRKALQEGKKSELETIHAVKISEQAGVKGRRYLVVRGSHDAVEKALPALQTLLEEAKHACGRNDANSMISGKDAGQAILKMVAASAARPAEFRTDPQPISTDEFLLSAIEAREDAEIGADKSNFETFGETGGWSHEENVAANVTLLNQPELGPPPGLPSSKAACASNPAKEGNKPEEPKSSSRLCGPDHRPPPPPVPAWTRPLTIPTQEKQSPQKEARSAKYQPSPGPATPCPMECTPSPKIAQIETIHDKWSCPACTLLNAKTQTKCGACGGPRPGQSQKQAWHVFAAPKAMPRGELKAKAGKAEEPADPLPQRKSAPRPTPRMLAAGLVVGDLQSNAASGPRWAERPVERLAYRTCAVEAEEDDPDLACYLWNRQLNRPKVERRQRTAVA